MRILPTCLINSFEEEERPMSTRNSPLIVLIAILLVAACVAPPPAVVEQAQNTASISSDEPTEPVTLNLNLGSEPLTADPGLAIDGTSAELIEQMFAGLTDYATDSTAVVPELATDWSVSDDGHTWTYHMRDDVPWVRWDPETQSVVQETDISGNVRMVNAHDVVYGVKRTLDPRTSSQYAYVLYSIAGAVDLNTAEAVTQELLDGVAVHASDDFTVEFTLESPAAYFPSIASLWVARPAPQWAIETHGEQWTQPGNMVSNGPFVMTEWNHEDSISLVRNPFWPGWKEPGSGNIDRIEYVMVPDNLTALALYDTDHLDQKYIQPTDFGNMADDPGRKAEMVVQPVLTTTYVGFTTNKPPVNDPLVRKALSAAIDRQSIVNDLRSGMGIPANAFAPPGIFGSVAQDPEIGRWLVDYAQGQELARQWMAEAGYPNGKGLVIELSHTDFEYMSTLGQAIQAMWKDTFPEADIRIEPLEVGVFFQSLNPGAPVEDAPMVWITAWAADYADENNWVHEVFSADEGINWPRAVPSQFEELTKQAQTENDPAKRESLYREAERLLVEEEARIAPLYFVTGARLDKPWLAMRSKLLGLPQMDTWSIDWEAKQAALGQ